MLGVGTGKLAAVTSGSPTRAPPRRLFVPIMQEPQLSFYFCRRYVHPPTIFLYLDRIVLGAMFPPSTLPLPGEVLLITDEILAPADFLLHRLLASHFKESQSHAGVLVSFSEDIGRWKAVASKAVSYQTSCDGIENIRLSRM